MSRSVPTGAVVTAGPRPAATSRTVRREIGPLLSLIGVAVLILAFGTLAAQVMDGDTLRFDEDVIRALRVPGQPGVPLGPPWFQEMARDVTALGSFAFLGLATAAVLGYLLLVGKRATAVLLVAAIGGGAVINTVMKYGFARPRPELTEQATRVFTPGFPSAHATLSAVTFLTLAVLLGRAETSPRLRVYLLGVALVLTVLVGASRIYLGVHYPTDVLAGWCVGAGWAIGCWAAAIWLQRRGAVERPGEGTANHPA